MRCWRPWASHIAKTSHAMRCDAEQQRAMTRRERDLRRLARRHGWHVEGVKRHWRLRSPLGHVLIVSATPSDGNNLHLVAACLRRAERLDPR
jgi:hypothetical protein